VGLPGESYGRGCRSDDHGSAGDRNDGRWLESGRRRLIVPRRRGPTATGAPGGRLPVAGGCARHCEPFDRERTWPSAATQDSGHDRTAMTGGVRTPRRDQGDGSRSSAITHARCYRITTLHLFRPAHGRNPQTLTMTYVTLDDESHDGERTGRAGLARGRFLLQLGGCAARRQSAGALTVDGRAFLARIGSCCGRRSSLVVRPCRCSATGWRSWRYR
jgi:hypothetical protein